MPNALQEARRNNAMRQNEGGRSINHAGESMNQRSNTIEPDMSYKGSASNMLRVISARQRQETNRELKSLSETLPQRLGDIKDRLGTLISSVPFMNKLRTKGEQAYITHRGSMSRAHGMLSNGPHGSYVPYKMLPPFEPSNNERPIPPDHKRLSKILNFSLGKSTKIRDIKKLHDLYRAMNTRVTVGCGIRWRLVGRKRVMALPHWWNHVHVPAMKKDEIEQQISSIQIDRNTHALIGERSLGPVHNTHFLEDSDAWFKTMVLCYWNHERNKKTGKEQQKRDQTIADQFLDRKVSTGFLNWLATFDTFMSAKYTDEITKPFGLSDQIRTPRARVRVRDDGLNVKFRNNAKGKKIPIRLASVGLGYVHDAKDLL